MSSESFPLIYVFIGLSFLLTACAENLPQDIPQSYNASDSYTFNVSYDKAWKGAVRALAADYRVKTLDKSSGLIVTEYMTVNKEVLTMFQTAMFGRTYKNSYSVNLYEEAAERTNIHVRSNLLMEQFAIYERERNVAWFEAYLRQELFRKICQVLYASNGTCQELFPDYKDGHITHDSREDDWSDNNDVALSIGQAQSVGISKEMVFEAQKVLKNSGYDPGEIDGIMGRRTQSALTDFQIDRNLKATGELDQPTVQELGIGSI